MKRREYPRDLVPVSARSSGRRLLTTREHQSIADVPPKAECSANLDSSGTERIYPTEIARVLAWRLGKLDQHVDERAVVSVCRSPPFPLCLAHG